MHKYKVLEAVTVVVKLLFFCKRRPMLNKNIKYPYIDAVQNVCLQYFVR